MEKIRIDNFKEDRFETAIALGNFDGVHIGHKKILLNMVEEARKLNLVPSILLFDNHSKLTTKGKAPMYLTTKDQKEEIIESLGIETLYNIKFDENLMRLQPEEFVKDILIDKLNTKLIVVGFDYRFGHKASGDVDLLKELAKKYGLGVKVIEPIYVDDILVSSTQIRELILDGDLELANKMLDRNFQISGRVIPGNKLGRKLGFPTANLDLLAEYPIPKHGVYRTETIIDGKRYASATNIGYNPTFDNKKVKIECHIIDFKGDLYDKIIYIDLIEFLRDEIKFDNLDDLIIQMEEDIKIVLARH